MSYYIIEEDMEGMLKVLNEKGEVVVKAGFAEAPVYIQIFATSEGLKVRHYEREKGEEEK